MFRGMFTARILLLIPAVFGTMGWHSGVKQVLADEINSVGKLADSGKCDLKKGVTKKYVDKRMALEMKCKAGTFFGRTIVKANATITNKSAESLYYQYYVIFRDKKGTLVGCASQGSSGDEGLPPNDEVRFGGCLIELPAGEIRKIVSYEMILYYDNKRIGEQKKKGDDGKTTGKGALQKAALETARRMLPKVVEE